MYYLYLVNVFLQIIARIGEDYMVSSEIYSLFNGHPHGACTNFRVDNDYGTNDRSL